MSEEQKTLIYDFFKKKPKANMNDTITISISTNFLNVVF